MKKKMMNSLIFTALLVLPNIVNAKEVKICDDKGEWPPFTYFERINGQPIKLN